MMTHFLHISEEIKAKYNGTQSRQSPEKVKNQGGAHKKIIDFFANLPNRSNRGKTTFWANGGNLEQSAKNL